MQPFPEALATGRSDFSLPFGRMIHRFSGGTFRSPDFHCNSGEICEVRRGRRLATRMISMSRTADAIYGNITILYALISPPTNPAEGGRQHGPLRPAPG